MSRKTVFRLLVIIIILLIFGFTFLLVDFNLTLRNNEPKFSFCINEYNKANTKEYIGLGYKIIRYNIDDNYQVKLGSLFLQYDDSLDYNNNISYNKLQDNTVYEMVGKVKSITKDNENNVILFVESTNSISVYPKANVIVNNDTIIQKDNLKLTLDNIVDGSIVKIKFSGNVENSNPVKGIAKKIEFVK